MNKTMQASSQNRWGKMVFECYKTQTMLQHVGTFGTIGYEEEVCFVHLCQSH